jgi:hypothetical protein
MAKQTPHPDEEKLIAKIFSFKDDPLEFVRFVFPWGQPGSPLEYVDGPRAWQIEALTEMRDHIARNRALQSIGRDPELLKLARASGRGIGKSAFLAWVALWLFSSIPSATVIVSANTEGQLKTTTFPEIRKWATMAIHSRWFEHQITGLYPSDWLVQALKESTQYDDAYWYIKAHLWSEENPDAYAGPHSQQGMAVLFDEASGIPANIWPVAGGYFTDKTTHRFWIAIGNPRNPSGEFFECFNVNRDQWTHKAIDGRSVEENDAQVYQDIIDRYGEDSDEARVEVYGQFPRQGDDNFISRGEIEDAVARELIEDHGSPLLMGVDPARMGRDKAVIRFRQGRDARTIAPIVYPKCTTEQLAEYCATAIDRYQPDHVFFEADGVGGPVIELLEKAGYKIIHVTAAATALDSAKYYLHRTELWGRMRDWVSTGCLPDEPDLVNDLATMRYSINLKGQLALWPKEKMRKEGVASPDYADALAVTFSKTVARRDGRASHRLGRNKVATGMDYAVLG